MYMSEMWTCVLFSQTDLMILQMFVACQPPTDNLVTSS